MEWTAVESKRITHYRYDDEEAVIQVKFHDGVCWEYRGVSPAMWADFQAAPSKGSFIHRVLNNQPHGRAEC